SPLLSGPATNQPAIFQLFKTLIHCSERVVMMDGLPTAQLYRFLADDMQVWPEFKVLQHLRPGEEKQFLFMDEPSQGEDLVMRTLKTSGESVVLVSDSKAVLKYMHRKVATVNPFLPILTLCGDADHTVKRTAQDPTRFWTDLRYLAYYTSLGPGASFDARTIEEGAFSEMVCVFTWNTCSPSEM